MTFRKKILRNKPFLLWKILVREHPGMECFAWFIRCFIQFPRHRTSYKGPTPSFTPDPSLEYEPLNSGNSPWIAWRPHHTNFQGLWVPEDDGWVLGSYLQTKVSHSIHLAYSISQAVNGSICTGNPWCPAFMRWGRVHPQEACLPDIQLLSCLEGEYLVGVVPPDL